MPNPWVHVGSDQHCHVDVCAFRDRPGVYTSLPTLLAEQLGVDINKIKVEMAPVGEHYINMLVGGQLTGGSTSVREAYDRLRVAGAQARIVLIQAAAKIVWRVRVGMYRGRCARARTGCCLLYTSPSPRDKRQSRMPSSA